LNSSSSASLVVRPFGAGLGFLFLASVLDVVHQLFVSLVTAHAIFFALAEFNRTHGGEVLRVLRNFDQVFRLCTLGNCDLAFLPHARNIRLPGLAHAANKTIGTTQQQDMRPQCMAASQDAQVLQNDRLEQRRHQFIRRSAHLLQAVDVGLGKDATLPGNFMQFDSVIFLFAQFKGREFSAWH
jgi:hypothetical protein